MAGSMSPEVFISHASPDRTTASALTSALEQAGISCWIAPRDIVPGDAWPAAIVRALRGCRLVVLVLSSHSNVSHQVHRELERAGSLGRPIVPVRIEDVAPSEVMEYFISSRHWLDAPVPVQPEQLAALIESVNHLRETPAAPVRRHAASAPWSAPSPWPRVVMATVAMLCCTLIATAYLLRPVSAPPTTQGARPAPPITPPAWNRAVRRLQP